ncbi:4Fe-4S binding protein [Candidatus Parcubacteria bacterium]|nr:4Fe-4S binding protein [Patescibacteria group bacterium]MBU4309110.1 4Fe-4S binding protein [Patescibacteria group bacterium]MBU4432706.1 4Fe-4S binding protein [Patescibacteria group bacterium]MBU4577471.1 4Fe-4S binding protein [Patescibacteria group bacterium]MCG2697159.1 4Fe-4S binding protein [Candidatus Parcubacteria bacterium]
MKKIFTFRFIVQVSVFALLIFLSLSHLKYGIEKAASIDAYCPFGAVESFLTKIETGDYLKRIWTSAFLLMGITLLTTVLFGRVFCSYFCPLGALQEWLRAIGRKLGIKKDIELPRSIDKYARYLKYLVLAFIVYYSYRVGDLFFRDYDPYNALMHFGNEFEEKVAAYAILGIVLVSALFSKSWWCRYACPMGAFLGIVKKISPFKIKRESSTCTSCGNCDKVCPANLDIQTAEAIKSADCISCLNCVSDCPSDSLSARVFNKLLSKKTFGIIAVLSFLVPLAIVVVTPFWETMAPSNIVNTKGVIDVANIRGSNTLKKVVEDSKVPLEVFVNELNLPKDIDSSLMLKNIGIQYDLKNAEGAVLETEDFRAVISDYFANK